ncbi:MAG: acyl-CoA dehydrogenase [Alphaproteobacteria bacterium]|nr:acyl-CoA dehydrogenase [Alphaproteobacteria bacterium]
MSELSNLLADTVERLFDGAMTREVLQAAETGNFQADLWRAVEAAGLPLALADEAAGGAGATWADALPILLGAGRHAVPLPLAEAVAAGALLSQAGAAPPSGAITLASGILVVDAAGKVSGALAEVPWGVTSDHVVAATADGGLALVAVDAAVRTGRHRNIGRDARDTLVFAGACPEALVPAGNCDGGASVMRAGAMVRAAQLAGGIGKALDMAVLYAGERVQFSRPIGRFQAVQQQLAELAVQAAQAGMAVRVAASALDAGGDAGFAVASAKIVCSDAAGLALRVAHEVHGAIGFTDEHMLHYVTRRITAWRGEFGSAAYWAARLGRDAARRGGDALWPDLVARQTLA